MSIEKEAFACCSRLDDIELPPHADIASDAFEDTPWQEARDEVFQIRGSSLEYINNNTEPVLIIPYGVTELADSLFSVRAQFLNDDLTVYGQKGSRAEELAVHSGYKFVEVENGDEMP